MYSIGIDIGGTSIKAARFDGREIVGEVLRFPTSEASAMRATLSRAISQLLKGMTSDCSGIGIGTPGLVNSDGYLCGQAVNIPGWDKVQIVDYVREDFSLPVIAANDVNMAAYGEWRFSTARNGSSPIRSMVCVVLGTGVGSGIIIDGSILTGASAMAGEIGHIVVDPGGRQCNCGLRGCLERYASATGIAHSAALYAEEYDTPLARRLRTGEVPDAQKIYHALEEGDSLARAVHRETCMRLAMAVGILTQTINPELIVFGGGVMESGDTILRGVEEYMDDYVFPVGRADIRLSRARLGEKAGVYGAAVKAWDNFSPT